MTPRDFFRDTLPSTGRICLVLIKRPGGNARQQFYTTPEDAAQGVADALAAGNNDIYYLIGTAGAEDKRNAHNVVAKRSLYLDLDCGEGKEYPDPGTALSALEAFVDKVGLPKPNAVQSGNGVHIYWFFENAIATHDWHPVAQALKAKCVSEGLKADDACTADMARIFRVPGTVNLKNNQPLPVTFLGKAVKYHSFESLRDIIGVAPEAERKGFQPNKELPEALKGAHRSFKMDASTKALADMRETKYEHLVAVSNAGNGCAQVKWAWDNRTSLREPDWRAHIAIAAACDDAEWGIHNLSKDDPRYDYNETAEKARQTSGPTRCDTFRSSSHGEKCNGCKQPSTFSTISPIYFARVITEKTVDEVAAAVKAKHNFDKELPICPEPFFYGNDGSICRRAESEDEEPQLVYPHLFYVFKRMVDPAQGHTAWIRVFHPKDGVKEFCIPMAAIAARDKLRDSLAAEGFVMFTLKQQDGLQFYVNKMVAELQYKEEAEIMRSQFGWTPDGSFVLGDREIARDGVHYSPPSASIRGLSDAMKPVGSIEQWSKIANFYDRPGMEAFAFVLFAGFGAPLMRLTPVNGVLINLVSNNSGTGKTTAMKVVNSIYGDSGVLMSIERDTALAKMQRLGTLSALPMTIDEITNMPAESLSDFVYGFTHGRGRNRMEAKSNAERVNSTQWKTLGISTSNRSIVDTLRSLKNNPQGELARVMEFNIDAPDTDKEEAEAVFNLMQSNYGVAGDIYIRHIVSNWPEVVATYEYAKSYVAKQFKFTGPERFFEHTVTAALAGASLAKSVGVIDIEIKRVVEWLKVNIDRIRGDVFRKTDYRATVASYINENFNNVLVVNGKPTIGGMQSAPFQEPRNRLDIRYEPDTGKLYLVEGPFLRWCAQRQVNLTEMKEEVTLITGALMQLTRVRIGAGTKLDAGLASVYMIENVDALRLDAVEP